MKTLEGIRRLFAKVPLRRISTTKRRRTTEDLDSAPPAPAGDTLPFGINHTGYLLTGFSLFVATGFGIPFAILRYQCLKAAS